VGSEGGEVGPGAGSGAEQVLGQERVLGSGFGDQRFRFFDGVLSAFPFRSA
jgi:hypothetical protein